MSEVVKLAELLIARDNYQEALKLLLGVVDAHSNMADYYQLLGVVYHHMGEFSNAVESYEQALDLNPNYTQALLNLTVLLNDLGQYDKASEIFHRIEAVRSDGQELDGYIKGKIANAFAETAHMFVELGQYEEAISRFRHALEIKNDMVDVKCSLADVYIHTDHMIKAIAELEEARKLNPHFTKVFRMLGVAYYKTGNTNKAVDLWKQAIEMDPEDEVAICMLESVDAEASLTD